MPKLKDPPKVRLNGLQEKPGREGCQATCIRPAHSDVQVAQKRKNKLHTGVVADESDQAKLQRMIPY